MNMDKYVGGDFVTMDSVKNSPTKTGVFLSAGAEVEFKGKKKVEFLVEMDGKQLKYTPNQTSIANYIDVWGNDSTNWVGKVFKVDCGQVQGKDAILGMAMVPTQPQPVQPVQQGVIPQQTIDLRNEVQ